VIVAQTPTTTNFKGLPIFAPTDGRATLRFPQAQAAEEGKRMREERKRGVEKERKRSELKGA